jgi:hypothetical protein
MCLNQQLFVACLQSISSAVTTAAVAHAVLCWNGAGRGNAMVKHSMKFKALTAACAALQVLRQLVVLAAREHPVTWYGIFVIR